MKYEDLVVASRSAGYETELMTIEVGSRGMVGISSFERLKAVLKVSQKDTHALCMNVIRTTILESYKIWCSRNHQT